MRKLLLTTAAVAAAIGLAGCSKKEPITYGTLSDERDGQTYRTVKIGEQTWMAQNLNYKTDNSWCNKKATYRCEDCKARIEEDTSYCDKYGRLYDWTTAMTACPDGYHLPSRKEWGDLVKTAGGIGKYGTNGVSGYRLKAKRGWNENDYDGVIGNGTDDYGFSALPGGYHTNTIGEFGGYDDNIYAVGEVGYWWTATIDTLTSATYYRCMGNDFDDVTEVSGPIYISLSVRCVADRP